jgi:hypothetical protein
MELNKRLNMIENALAGLNASSRPASLLDVNPALAEHLWLSQYMPGREFTPVELQTIAEVEAMHAAHPSPAEDLDPNEPGHEWFLEFLPRDDPRRPPPWPAPPEQQPVDVPPDPDSDGPDVPVV